MYFRLGGGTLKGVSKVGEIVWSRIYVENGRLRMDLGRAGCRSKLPEAETAAAAGTQRRRRNGRSCIAVTYGVSRDQMMAKHQANHIQVAYANSFAAEADKAMLVKASMASAMGIKVSICGTKKDTGQLLGLSTSHEQCLAES